MSMSDEAKDVANALKDGALKAATASSPVPTGLPTDLPIGQEAETEEGDDEAAPKKKKSKKAAIIGAIVAVIAAFGFGFYQWHETPEFCVTICHTPMDTAYLDTLYANPYGPAKDKWGNEVSKADAMLASKHGAMGKRCMACHWPAIQEQVTEGVEWISGNYYNPLSERDLAQLVFYRGNASETEFCLNSGCHDISKTGLTEETKDMARNPHSWHHSEYTCSDCHKGHRASVMVCSQCHEDAEIPDGWLTWDESKALENQYMSYNEEKFLESQTV